MRIIRVLEYFVVKLKVLHLKKCLFFLDIYFVISDVIMSSFIIIMIVLIHALIRQNKKLIPI